MHRALCAYLPQSHYEMKTITGVGAIIYRKRPAQTEVLLIRRNRYGNEWSLPKGKLETGESLENGLKREIREETGFEIEIDEKIGELHYPVPEGEKTVHYFKVKAVSGEFQPNEEVSEIRWLKVAEAANLLTYADQRKLLTKTNF